MAKYKKGSSTPTAYVGSDPQTRGSVTSSFSLLQDGDEPDWEQMPFPGDQGAFEGWKKLQKVKKPDSK